MRILFFGTPLFARIVLESFVNDANFNVVGLVTQQDKPFNRTRELKMPDTKAFLCENHIEIPIYQPQNLQGFGEILATLRFDVILVVAYGRILPKSIINAYPCFNIHASILPKYRGASPMQEMILRDEKYMGVSVIKIQESLDSGEILGVSYVKNEYDDIVALGEKLSVLGANLAKKVLRNLAEIAPLAQNEAESSLCKKITKNDGLIALDSAREVFLRALAYKGYPNIFLESGLKLFEVKLNEAQGTHKSGEILGISGDSIIIGCKMGSIKVGALQDSGKKRLPARAYLNGRRLKIGDIL